MLVFPRQIKAIARYASEALESKESKPGLVGLAKARIKAWYEDSCPCITWTKDED